MKKTAKLTLLMFIFGQTYAMPSKQDCINELDASPVPCADEVVPGPHIQALVKTVADTAKMASIPDVAITSSPCPMYAYLQSKKICLSKTAKLFENDAQLEAFLGHEMSHIKNNDPIPSFLLAKIALCILPLTAFAIMWKKSKRPRTTKALISLTAAIATLPLVGVINYFAQQKSRAIEKRADLDGCSRPELTRAMIEVVQKHRSLLSMLRVLLKQTHPTHAQRICYLQEHLREQLDNQK